MLVACVLSIDQSIIFEPRPAFVEDDTKVSCCNNVCQTPDAPLKLGLAALQDAITLIPV